MRSCWVRMYARRHGTRRVRGTGPALTTVEGPGRNGTVRTPRSEGATEHGGDAAQVYCPPLREIRLSLHGSDRREVRTEMSPSCRMMRHDRPRCETEKGRTGAGSREGLPRAFPASTDRTHASHYPDRPVGQGGRGAVEAWPGPVGRVGAGRSGCRVSAAGEGGAAGQPVRETSAPVTEISRPFSVTLTSRSSRPFGSPSMSPWKSVFLRTSSSTPGSPSPGTSSARTLIV